MTPLEQRYRRLTRLLPRHYREDWEDDLVSTFLEVTTADAEDPEFEFEYGSPGWAEAASVAGLAIRLRVSPGGPRRYALAGEVVRGLALAGTTFHAALALVTGVLRLSWPPPMVRDAPTPTLLLDLLWLPALGFLLAERRGYALAFAAAATAGTALDLSGSAGLLVLQLATLLALTVHPKPTTVHIRQWLIACVGTAVVSFLIQWTGVTGYVGVAGVVTLLAGLMLIVTTRAAARETWFAAAVVVVAAQLVDLPALVSPLVPSAVGVLAGVVVLGVVLTFRVRALHEN